MFSLVLGSFLIIVFFYLNTFGHGHGGSREQGTGPLRRRYFWFHQGFPKKITSFRYDGRSILLKGFVKHNDGLGFPPSQ